MSNFIKIMYIVECAKPFARLTRFQQVFRGTIWQNLPRCPSRVFYIPARLSVPQLGSLCPSKTFGDPAGSTVSQQGSRCPSWLLCVPARLSVSQHLHGSVFFMPRLITFLHNSYVCLVVIIGVQLVVGEEHHW